MSDPEGSVLWALFLILGLWLVNSTPVLASVFFSFTSLFPVFSYKTLAKGFRLHSTHLEPTHLPNLPLPLSTEMLSSSKITFPGSGHLGLGISFAHPSNPLQITSSE